MSGAGSVSGGGASDLDGLTNVSITSDAKGDIIVRDATEFKNKAVGADGKFLKADSTDADGVIWDDVPDPTLQEVYDASSNPEVTVDATRGALTVRDNATPIAANLFEVQNNAGTTTYLSVTADGAFLVVNGTTAQRPGSPSNGMTRYNTTTSKLETYEAGAWTDVVGGGGAYTAFDAIDDIMLMGVS